MVGTIERETVSGLCSACGIPLDSQYFDDSSIRDSPGIGQETLLARFDIPPQYCGVLQYFSQFTDTLAANPIKVATPSLEWQLLVNNHALFPYINLRQIVNPWGFGTYQVNIRLEENSTVELVVRGVVPDPKLAGSNADSDPDFIGGRIAGRFWYNAAYGDVIKHRH